MQPNPDDHAYLWDMREAALEVMRFVEGLDYASYVEDHMRLLAVERGLEIIGEAARRVSSSLKLSVPDIPWREINGLRNVLAHDYGSIDHELIWNQTLPKLPNLVQQLDALIPPLSDDK
jgi:uncharacterized protein with HEPN domain